jgi:hypothetical protein
MSSKGFQSPLKRAQAGEIGVPKEQEQETAPQQINVETLKHINVQTQKTTLTTRKSDNVTMKRQTIFMPEELAIWLKVYAARKGDDMSGVVTKLVEQLRNREE